MIKWESRRLFFGEVRAVRREYHDKTIIIKIIPFLLKNGII